jgi:hypothetical protein
MIKKPEMMVSSTQINQQTSAAWANSAAKDTVKSLVSIPQPAHPVINYLISVVNPSTESDLTVKLLTTRGGVKSYLTSLTVPKSATIKGTAIGAYDFLVQGLFVAGSLDIDLSNDTAVGGSGTFSATVTVYEA